MLHRVRSHSLAWIFHQKISECNLKAFKKPNKSKISGTAKVFNWKIDNQYECCLIYKQKNVFQLTLTILSSCNRCWDWKKQHFFLRNTYFFRINATSESTTKGSRNRSQMRFATQSNLICFLRVPFRLLISSNNFAKKLLDEANEFECCVSWIRCMHL